MKIPKKLCAEISALAVCLLVFSGCASMTAGKNPWAPPEKKKSVVERWEEVENRKRAEERAAPAARAAAPAPAVSVSESRDVATVLFADVPAKHVVAYRFGEASAPFKKGEYFAVRGKDLALRGVVQLVLSDGATLGFSLIGGTASADDFITKPGEKLRAEMEKAFPLSMAPEPAAR